MKALKYILSFICASLVHTEVIDLTVLIHGTVGSICIMHHRGLAHKNWADLADRWGAQWQQVYRRQPILKQFWPMQDFGLQLLDHTDLTKWHAGNASVDDYKLAIYPIALSYDALHQNQNKKMYATFGWTGVLHDELRTIASEELYVQLCNLKDVITKQGDELKIHIVAHSHGGNVALKLVGQESNFNNKLAIETLVLWGTPIQEETIYFAESPFFKTIINCFSPYDIIQKGDGFSTKNGKSKQRLHDKIDCHVIQKRNNIRRVDLELQVNGSSMQVDHANLWILGKSQRLSPEICHLPYMVFTPALKELISDCDSVHMHANLLVDSNRVVLELHDKKTGLKKLSQDFRQIVDVIKQQIIPLWNPDEKHTGMIFSKANPLNFLFKRNKPGI